MGIQASNDFNVLIPQDTNVLPFNDVNVKAVSSSQLF